MTFSLEWDIILLTNETKVSSWFVIIYCCDFNRYLLYPFFWWMISSCKQAKKVIVKLRTLNFVSILTLVISVIISVLPFLSCYNSNAPSRSNFTFTLMTILIFFFSDKILLSHYFILRIQNQILVQTLVSHQNPGWTKRHTSIGRTYHALFQR